ncbi:MAG TPA: Rieske (2Fe-2S) protein [Polyangiaceae bacterium]|jgi:Rieske Fe-S protein
MSGALARRAFLRMAGGAAACACSASNAPASAPSCATDGTGPGLSYCLIASKKLRVPGGARIGPGQVVMAVLDDNTAGILARDAKGLYALSATCTHACCTVNVCVDAACAAPVTTPAPCASPAVLTLPAGAPAFLCPCHGSEYQADGTVVRGPAPKALPSLAVEVDGDDALIDMSRTVEPTARVG